MSSQPTPSSDNSHDVSQQQEQQQEQQKQKQQLQTRAQSIYDMIMSQQPGSVVLTSKNYSPEAAYHRPVGPYESSSSSSNSTTTTTQSKNSNNNNNNNNDLALSTLTQKSLPYFQPWTPTSGPSQLPPDFTKLSESCGGKAAIGVFGGGVMGLLMGVFLGAMSDMTPPVTVIAGKEVPQAPLKEQVRTTMRATAEKSMYWCRQFAFITGVFGGSECLVEKYRGKTDVWNSVLSGCVTGAAMQAKAGPSSAAFGCGGFAAFSLVIDSVMGTHS